MSPGLKSKKIKHNNTAFRELEENSYQDNYKAMTNTKRKEETLEPIQDYSSNSEYETEQKSNILSQVQTKKNFTKMQKKLNSKNKSIN